jgi:hypothetical protein
MNQEHRDAIAQCGFCGQGLLHLFRCPRCSAVVALCDECELIWDDVTAVHADPGLRSDSSYPQCPRCGARDETWHRLTRPEIDRAHLDRLLLRPDAD